MKIIKAARRGSPNLAVVGRPNAGTGGRFLVDLRETKVWWISRGNPLQRSLDKANGVNGGPSKVTGEATIDANDHQRLSSSFNVGSPSPPEEQAQSLSIQMQEERGKQQLIDGTMHYGVWVE
ncbi:hypothetical protein VB005_11354 [Metarhizium brunneum]